MKMEIVGGTLGADVLAQLAPDESALVSELTARADTLAMLVTDGAGRLIGYAVIGLDDAEIVTVYAARSLNHMMARAAMIGLFGASQVMGHPIRVHTVKLRSMAKMMGAESALACLDGDGVPMGVFNGV